MIDYAAKGEDFEKRADKKLTGWGLFSNKYEDAADLYVKAANSFKIAKSWDRTGAVYVKLANCQIKCESKHEAANAFAEAGLAYKNTSSKEVCSCFEQALNCFLDIGRLTMAAKYSKKIAEIYEKEENLEQAIVWFEKAADLFQSEEGTSNANTCKQQVAQFAAQLEQYPKAAEIYEDLARYSLNSLNSYMLKFGVKGYLLNAGICHLCKGDVVAITNALEKYQDMDPTFRGTRECKLLSDLAGAMDEGDVAKFTNALKEFDSITKLDPLKTTLLLRVKEKLKAKEIEDDDDLT